jgi:hypothetical protein
MSGFSPPLLEWHFRGHCYTPLCLHYSLSQATDYVGRPSSTVRFHALELLLDGADVAGEPVQAVYDYMLDSYARRSNLVLVRRPGTGAMLRRIELQDAYCTFTREHFEPGNAERLPALVLRVRLSPAALVLDGLVVEQFSVLPWAASAAQRERARTPAVELPPSAALAARLRQVAQDAPHVPTASARPMHKLAELTEEQLLPTMKAHGLPPMGLPLSYLPSDDTLRELTVEFGVEFAIIYTLGSNNRKGHYTLYAGTENEVKLDVDPSEYLIKHTHPKGTAKPSPADITYLINQQAAGSKQIKSVILPIGKPRCTFTKDTPPAVPLPAKLS